MHDPDQGGPSAAGSNTAGEAHPADEPFDDRSAPAEVVAVGIVALLAGGVLRFVTTSSLWLDEALSVNIAQLPVGEIGEALRHDGHPPLYYVLLHYWIELFGSGDVAVRALSGVVGLLTLPLAWLAGRRLGGPLLAWITLAVATLSPYAVRYSDEARMYSLVMLLVLAGYLLVDDVVRRDRAGWPRLVAIAAVAALLLYTHYWSVWLLASVGLLLLWRAWRTSSREVRGPALRVAGALVVGGVLFLPWLPAMLHQSANTGTPWADPMRPTAALAITLVDLGSGPYTDGILFAGVLLLAIVLGLFGRGVDAWRVELDLRTRPQLRAEAAVAALTFVIGIGVSYVARSAFATRYAAVLFPFLVLLVAAGVTRFLGRWVRFGALLVLCGILGVGALWNVRDSRTQAGAVGEAIDAVARPGDLVVYCPDQLGPAGSRAITADVEQLRYPDLGDPRFVDWVDYQARNDAADPAAIAAEVVERAGPERGIFVVWNGAYRTFEGDCEALVNAIGAVRAGQELVEQQTSFFEHAYVSWFPGAP